MMKNVEVHEKKPAGFKALVEVSACYIEIEGNILLLQQGAKKQETGAWGVPAGKIENYETAEAAACRELFEETGIQIEKASQMQNLGCLYMRKPQLDYVYHLFQVKIEKTPAICISQEHQAYGWFPIQRLNNLVLMSGAKEGLDFFKLRRI